MLSILIPNYNYNVLPLIEELVLQATNAAICFEIICIDDCSEHILFDQKTIENLANVNLILLKKNIGRSAIRNLLVSKSNFENLLFIDAGTFPKSNNLIKTYLENITENITVGGMVNEARRPNKLYILRWLYTKKREICFDKRKNVRVVYSSANFLIKKSTFQIYPFDETIKEYGFEDFLFFKKIEKNKIKIQFINNPVIHDSKEDAKTFIKKTDGGLKNIALLLETDNSLIKDHNFVKLYTKIKKIKFNTLIIPLFKLTKPLIVKNLNSAHPSLILFDFYRFGYFCSLKPKC